jgi:hypothetical protein
MLHHPASSRLRQITVLAFAIGSTLPIPAQRKPSPTALVPFVGCAADGMSGPVAAPHGRPKPLHIPPAAAARLAYYVVSSNLSVLGPRGWHCHDIYGSGGDELLLTPDSRDLDRLLATTDFTTFTGPIIELDWHDGMTSGRDEVAPVIARVFHAHKSFAANAAAEYDNPPHYTAHPYPADTLHYLSREALEYLTPPHAQGLGTSTRLRPSGLPITGAQILITDDGDCCDLVSLAIRLPPADAALAPIILHQLEHDTHPTHSVPAQ